jgi:hypothetical protein
LTQSLYELYYLNIKERVQEISLGFITDKYHGRDVFYLSTVIFFEDLLVDE